MANFRVGTKDGRSVSDNHRTALGALRLARKHCLQLGELTVHEFPDRKARTGRPVMRVAFTGEWDWRGHELKFWNDGSPIL